MRRLATLALIATAAACASPRPGAADNPDARPAPYGSYALVRIDNRGLPTRSPTEPNMTLLGGNLTLARGNVFTLTLAAGADPNLPATQQTIRGEFNLTGNELTLTPAATSQGHVETYQYFRAGTELRLRDAQGHQWTFISR